MTFEQIYEPQMKEKAVRKILEALSDWFIMEEGREQYIKESAEQICIGAIEKGSRYTDCSIIIQLKQQDG